MTSSTSSIPTENLIRSSVTPPLSLLASPRPRLASEFRGLARSIALRTEDQGTSIGRGMKVCVCVRGSRD